MKDGIAGLISSKDDWSFVADPNAVAKSILIKQFNLNRLELNRIASKKNEELLLGKLRRVKKIYGTLEEVFH
jgi:hypothetical protein